MSSTTPAEPRRTQPEGRQRHDARWYVDGLRFECTGCGRCCEGGDGYVWVGEQEIRALARHLALDLDDFGRRFLRRVGDGYALLDRAPEGRCIFLVDSRCSVYEARPRQCVSFPFWTKNLESAAAWAHAAARCEGISDDAPVVELADIDRLGRQPAPARAADAPPAR